MPRFLHHCIGEDDLGGDDRGHPARIIRSLMVARVVMKMMAISLTRNSNPTI